jgi:hypothetical protein
VASIEEMEDAQGLGIRLGACHGEATMGGMEVGRRQAQLVQVVGALRASPRLSGGVNRRHKDRQQQAGHRNHHQQLDKSEAAASQDGAADALAAPSQTLYFL